MAKRLTDDEILAQIPAARQRANDDAAAGLRATTVRFDRKRRRFNLELTNGVLLGVPVATLPHLEGATTTQLATVTLTPSGAGLRIDALDADYSVAGIVQSSVGRRLAAKAFAQLGGSVTSHAKASAARTNGAKGGRPRTRAKV